MNFSKKSLKGKVAITALPLTKIIYLSFALGSLSVLVSFLLQGRLPPQIPLFYGLPEGEGQLTSKAGIIIPGIMALVISTFNTLICLYLENTFLQKALILTSLVVNTFTLITTIKIIFLVGSF